MSKKIVNVASVPKWSPFRYPGGKTWLVPSLRRWLSSLPGKPAKLIEPFAGGGIISLTVAFENLAEGVLMVELDDDIAAVWETILGEDAEWLARRITKFELSVESARAELSKPPRSLRQKAFQTILRNRVYHGGIMAHGSGLIKFGENGKGIKSRWYPQTLKRRVLSIAEMRGRIHFVEGDGMRIIRENAHQPNSVFFIDPPYTAAGKKAGTRLYKHNELDHEELFRLMATVAGDFLMTYDNASGVVEMAGRHGFETEAIPMKNTHHAEMTELLIGKNLKWVRRKSQDLLFEC